VTSDLFKLTSGVSSLLSTGYKQIVFGLLLGIVLFAAGLATTAYLRRGGTGTHRVSIGGRKVALAALATLLLFNLGLFTRWATNRKYVIEEIKHSLPQLIGEDSVIFGPFAALMTQDAGMRAVSYLDPLRPEDVFTLYGVTHQLMDIRSEGMGLREDLPVIEAETENICGWAFRSRYVPGLELRRFTGSSNQRTAFERGAALLNQGEWAQARLEFESFRRVSSHNLPEAMFKEAVCLVNLGEADSAMHLLSRAHWLRPDDPMFLQNLGVLSSMKGDLEAARDYWMRALKLEPHNTGLILLMRERLPR
jgi:tetratricopeptide (TPR) repeat protein